MITAIETDHPPPEREPPPERPVFVDLYRQRYRSMVEIARLTTGSTELAEEITQDAFVDLYRRYERIDRPEAYLRRAVVSRCTPWVRRRVLERRHLATLRPAHPAEHDSDTVAVMAAVERLPVRQRTAIVLRYFGDWSEQQIADALDCRPGTVKSLLSRARTRLEKDLSDDD